MNVEQLLGYYLNPSAGTVGGIAGDPYWDSVILLLRLDNESDNRGHGPWKDYSKYKNHTFVGGNDIVGSMPEIGSTTSTSAAAPVYLPSGVSSAAIFSNAAAQSIRNVSPGSSQTDWWDHVPGFLKVNGETFNWGLDTGDWTIEFSVYIDSFTGVLQHLFSANREYSYNSDALSWGFQISTGNELQFFYRNPSWFAGILPNSKQTINIPNIGNTAYTAATWYTVALSKQGSSLRMYINGIFTGAVTAPTLPTTTNGCIYIAGDPVFTIFGDTPGSFTGCLSNLRITTVARYTGATANTVLPYPFANPGYTTDTYGSLTKLYLPGTYDTLDYSNSTKLISGTENIRDVATNHYIKLTDGEQLQTAPYTDLNLDDNYSLEFYLNLNYENTPSTGSVNSQITVGVGLSNNTLIFPDDARLVLLTIRPQDNKKAIEIYLRRITANGELRPFAQFFVDGVTPITLGHGSNELALSNSGPFYPPGLSGAQYAVYGIDKGFVHFAISKIGTALTSFRHGVQILSSSINTATYSNGNNYVEIGRVDNVLPYTTINKISAKMRGIRFTKGTAPRYGAGGTFTPPKVFDLSLPSGVVSPARPRCVSIARTTNTNSISTQTCTWLVTFNRPVTGVDVNDFTLLTTDSLTSTSIVSVTTSNNIVYTLTANTGTGGGLLTLRLLDNNTIKDSENVYIGGNNPGSGAFQDQGYIIDKGPPVPILSSSAYPYVYTTFPVTLTFATEMASFDPNFIYVNNGTVSNFQGSNNSYTFDIVPARYGRVTVEITGGAGISASGLVSTSSAVLVREFNLAFPVLQLPLDDQYRFADISSFRHPVEEVVGNTFTVDTNIKPVGTTGTSNIQPFYENGGLKIPEFNAALNYTSDWTLEWFGRFDTRGNKTTHIFSVDSTYGICIMAINGFIRVRRTPDGGNLFNTVSWPEALTYSAWANESNQFPHFALTKEGNIYRFYLNGVRIGLVNLSVPFQIMAGSLTAGYRLGSVSEEPSWVSNIRLSLGKPLYTRAQFEVPILPFNAPLVIDDASTVPVSVSIVSNNDLTPTIAKSGDTISLTVAFNTPLSATPVITMLGRSVVVIAKDNNIYTTSVSVLNTDPDGRATFTIDYVRSDNIQAPTITTSTNRSDVVVDNTPPSVALSSPSPIDSRPVFEVTAVFSEIVQGLTVSDITVTNGYATNLSTLDGGKIFTFNVSATNTGTVSVQILANKCTDLATNNNTASNVYTRSATVSPYTPDPLWGQVIFLSEMTGPDNGISFTDLSTNAASITRNGNVVTKVDNAPPGLSSSTLFGGNSNDYLLANISSGFALTKDKNWTIEFFIYINAASNISLTAPVAIGADNITSTTFRARWNSVTDADSYELDVSRSSNFSSYEPKYKARNIGLSTNFTVGADTVAFGAIATTPTYIGSKGFIASWSKDFEASSYQLDVAGDKEFTTYEPGYQQKQVFNTTFLVGDFTVDGIYPDPQPIEEAPVTEGSSIVGSQISASLITGITGSNNQYPKIWYTSPENSIRVYSTDTYSYPLQSENGYSILRHWVHVAIQNNTKYASLYVNGVLHDKVPAFNFSQPTEIGAAIGKLYGYMSSFRITLDGQARYTGDTINIPTLPYGRD